MGDILLVNSSRRRSQDLTGHQMHEEPGLKVHYMLHEILRTLQAERRGVHEHLSSNRYDRLSKPDHIRDGTHRSSGWYQDGVTVGLTG